MAPLWHTGAAGGAPSGRAADDGSGRAPGVRARTKGARSARCADDEDACGRASGARSDAASDRTRRAVRRHHEDESHSVVAFPWQCARAVEVLGGSSWDLSGFRQKPQGSHDDPQPVCPVRARAGDGRHEDRATSGRCAAGTTRTCSGARAQWTSVQQLDDSDVELVGAARSGPPRPSSMARWVGMRARARSRPPLGPVSAVAVTAAGPRAVDLQSAAGGGHERRCRIFSRPAWRCGPPVGSRRWARGLRAQWASWQSPSG